MTELVKQTEAGLPAVVDFEADSGMGMEQVSQDDLVIPFVKLLQANSPEVDHEKGIIPGMFFNVATGEAFSGKEGISFVPIYLDKKYVEWTPIEKGGGLIAQYEIADKIVQELVAKQGKYKALEMSNGNELVETHYMYAAMLPNLNPVIIAFTSTKLSQLKNWLTKLNYFQVPTASGKKVVPPIFAHKVKLLSEKQTNKSGQDYYNVKFGTVAADLASSLIDTKNPDEVQMYVMAKDTCEAIKAGKAKVDFTVRDDAATNADPSAPVTTTADGEDIPF